MILQTLTLGSRNYFLPGSHYHRWWPASPEDSEDTLRYSLETLCPPLLLFPTIDKSLWITAYTCRSYLCSQLPLLLLDTLKNSSIVWESFVPTALCFFTTWIPLRIISRTYRVSTHPQLIHVCHQSSKYHSIFRKSWASYCSWNSWLLALWLIP